MERIYNDEDTKSMKDSIDNLRSVQVSKMMSLLEECECHVDVPDYVDQESGYDIDWIEEIEKGVRIFNFSVNIDCLFILWNSCKNNTRGTKN